ncbi:MAG: cyclic nucleotide-binding domain-containing protein, partial [Chloroflexi bacterium]|nr:cyclic nucleotide-binding domain-containing protein [Chloroflexota bacterium]
WDVVKMMKLNVAWDLGPIALTDSGRAVFDVVTPPFIRADVQRTRTQLALAAAIFAGLSPLEVDFIQRAGEETTPEPGGRLAADCLHVVLAGNAIVNGRTLGRGECFGVSAIFGHPGDGEAIAGQECRLLKLSPQSLADLSDRHPRLGVRLYRNLAEASR